MSISDSTMNAQHEHKLARQWSLYYSPGKQNVPIMQFESVMHTASCYECISSLSSLSPEAFKHMKIFSLVGIVDPTGRPRPAQAAWKHHAKVCTFGTIEDFWRYAICDKGQNVVYRFHCYKWCNAMKVTCTTCCSIRTTPLGF